MVIDGLTGSERALQFLGPVYNIIIASGDIFALIVAISILIFLARRIFFHIKRFEGPEMKRVSHIDANIALSIILLLMISLLMMNTGYVEYKSLTGKETAGIYPVSNLFAGFLNGGQAESFRWYTKRHGGLIYF